MTLEKIEAKFRKNYNFGNARASGSSGFIMTDGSVCATTNHAKACECMGMKLADVLEAGVCRYLFHVSYSGSVAAFEYHLLTPEQKTTIRKMLKTDDYFTVVTEKTTTDRQRPIRSIQF